MRRSPIHPAQSGTGIRHDGRQRLIDLMRDRRRHRAHPAHVCRARKLRPRDLQGVFGTHFSVMFTVMPTAP